MIRKANKKDIPKILQIYDYAHRYMEETNNPYQWPSTYPSREDVELDISNDALYVDSDGKSISGVFALYIGKDNNYERGIKGKWHYDLPYGTIHRIASSSRNNHFGDKAISYAKSVIGYLRIDTHIDNKTMQHVINKNGFNYCGEVMVRKDEPRLAYDWSKYKKIYIAGGCFWGVEHYYSLLKGIVSTKVGYANGSFANPSYEQLKHHEADHAETVEIIYDPEVISLTKILEHYLRFVDPYSIDKQGEDSGHQYRSGIYYTDDKEYDIIKRYLDEHIKGSYSIEILPLLNFYMAEEYHQEYLYKNPMGYCHINMHLIKDDEKK